MILDWIYSTPTWLWGTVVVITLDGAACIGLVIFHRLVHLEVRRAHNELTGFTVAVISVTYAVLLAFIAIATWESFTSSEDSRPRGGLRRQYLPRHSGLASSDGTGDSL